jgi:hypothetical protein
MTPQETTQFILREKTRWAKVVQDAGNTIEGGG